MPCRGQTRIFTAFKKVFPTHFLTIKTTCKPSRPHKLRKKEMKSINFPRQTFIVQKPGILGTMGSYSAEEKAPVLGTAGALELFTSSRLALVS